MTNRREVKIGFSEVPAGRGQLGVATFDVGGDAAKALTVGISGRVRPWSTDGGGHFETSSTPNRRIRAWLEYGGGASTNRREVPVGKRFGVVASGVRVFVEVWTNERGASTPAAAGDSLGEVEVYIGEGVANAAYPSLWFDAETNTSGDARDGKTLNDGGLWSVDPLVLLSVVGVNGGTDKRYLQVFDSSTVGNNLVFSVPVAAGDPFAIDLSNSGGRAFAHGISWAVSSTPGSYTADYSAAFQVAAEVLFL